MEEESVNYGTPANGASPGSNPILAQPPLAEVNASEGEKDNTATDASMHFPNATLQYTCEYNEF